MANDYVLAEAIQLIKAGKKEAARVMLERYLQRNPDNIQAWMWEAETFPSDADKIRVLEACLKNNPGNAQATQALNLLKSRVSPPPSSAAKPVSPFTTSPFEDASSSSSSSSVSPFTSAPSSPPPFTAAPPKKPLPFVTDAEPAAPKSVSPFTGVSPFVTDEPAPALGGDLKSPLPVETSQEQKIAAKKPARKMSKKTQMFLLAGAVLFFFLLVGGYFGMGIYLDGQINSAFAARQCETVVQRAMFPVLYPRALFSSLFDGYDQYDQCGVKLQAEHSAKAGAWADAFAFAQHYAALYPQGAFAEEMNEQAAVALSNWATQLVEAGDYAGGIERSKQFIETYPEHPLSGEMREGILRAYLDWAEGFFAAKNYAGAETYLREALTYFESDAARASQVREKLIETYLAWGDSQAAINNMEDAAKYYRQAGELSQGGVDSELLIAKAYLKQALEIADKNDFNRALTKIAEIESAAQAENVKAEAASAREQVLKQYSASDSIQAAEQIQLAIPAVCGGQIPTLPIFGTDENAVRAALFSAIIIPLPAEVSASTPGQLRYVACVTESEKEISSCPYEGGAVLYRLRYDWEVALYDIKTGGVVASETLRGGDPPECKKKELFTKGVKVKKSYGAKPTAEEVVAWLKTLGLLK